MKTRSVLIAVCVVLLIWLANWIIVKSLIYSPEAQGQFGDMFGASNALFSGLTIVGLLYTIYLQREDIKIARESFGKQKEEVEHNRQELILTREEFKQQNKTLKYQRFENTLFNLIDLHNNIVQSLPQQRKSFEVFIYENISNNKPMSDCLTIEGLLAEYHRGNIITSMGNPTVNTKAIDQFGQYLGNFESTIEFIIKTKRGAKIRDKYFRIYFAQFSNLERIFLLYHFKLRKKEVPIGYEQFKTRLFANLIDSNQILTTHFKILYDGVTS